MEEKQESINQTIEQQPNPSMETELPKKKEKKNKKEKASDAEILKLKEENATLNDKVLRINAELQNIKRRNSEEISRLMKYDGETFIKKLLPVIDNFERAINMDDDNLEDEVSKKYIR